MPASKRRYCVRAQVLVKCYTYVKATSEEQAIALAAKRNLTWFADGNPNSTWVSVECTSEASNVTVEECNE